MTRDRFGKRGDEPSGPAATALNLEMLEKFLNIN
jgi:hypothetical protein